MIRASGGTGVLPGTGAPGRREPDGGVDELVSDEVVGAEAVRDRLAVALEDREDRGDDAVDAVGVEVAERVVGPVGDDALRELDLDRVRVALQRDRRPVGDRLGDAQDGLVDRLGVRDVVDLGLLEHRHQLGQARRELLQLARAHRPGVLVDLVPGVVDHQVVGGLHPALDVVLPAVRLVRHVPLLHDPPALGDEAARGAVEGRVGLRGVHVALGDEVVHEDLALGVHDGGAGGLHVVPGVDVVRRRVEHDDLRRDLQRGEHAGDRELGVGAHRVVGGDEAEGDGGVLVHLRGHGLAAEEGAAEADLDVDAGVAEGPGVGALLDVHGAVGADELERGGALGGGEPVGLDDDRGGADVGEDALAGGGGHVGGRGGAGGEEARAGEGRRGGGESAVHGLLLRGS
ncbi:hypothetical protein ACFFXY_00675 [Glycomyces mayteni]|uniref:hypothetical protein n=1 Tax=Glycomyces mayteni TaxID=543887 RepID=UPI0035ED2329